MHSALPQQQTYLSRPTWRSRLVSFLLAAATTVLIALLMLAMGALVPGDKAIVPSSVVAIQIPPEQSGSKSVRPRTTTRHAAAAAPHPQPPVPQPHVVKQPVPVTPLLTMSKQEYAASDISKLPSHADEGNGSSSSGDSSTYGPGEGPGGEHLYNAEWYREPSRAELATYLSQTNGEGQWAMIACQTIEHYHVENCQELDESPPGSGLARALRRAAWQFLVRPPRKDGHVLIGSWVRIKFTFSKAPTSEPVEEAVPGADNGK